MLVGEAVWLILTEADMAKLELMAYMAYWVWRARCDVVYESKRWTSEGIFQVALQQLAEWRLLYTKQPTMGKQQPIK